MCGGVYVVGLGWDVIFVSSIGGIWPAPIITLGMVRTATGRIKLYPFDSWHDHLWKNRNSWEDVFEAEKGRGRKSCARLELKEKNSKRPFWFLYSDLFWGQRRTGEPSTYSGTSGLVRNLISKFAGCLRKQDPGAAAQGRVAHKMRWFGVYSRWLSSLQRLPSHFYSRHVCVMWQYPPQCP